MATETIQLASVLSFLWLGVYLLDKATPKPISAEPVPALIEWDPVNQSK